MPQLRLPAGITLPPALLKRLRALAATVGKSGVMYARISEDREGAHLGVDRQLEDQCDLYEQLGLRLVGVYADNDLSAYSGKPRPDYLAMLADLDAGIARTVTAWHTDRIHRNPKELEEYIDLSERRSIATHTVRAGLLDLSTPSGRMVARLLGATARYESEHKADRIARSRQQRAMAGRSGGGRRPFGFEDGGETIRPSEAAEIVEAANTLLSGGSLRSVTRDLNARGVLTTFGKQEWSSVALRDVLLRPRNAGLSVYRDEIVGKAVWPPILPEDRWRALVAILKSPDRRTAPGNRGRWLGSGLYVCGVCEEPKLRVQTAGGSRRKPAYRCSNRDMKVATGHVVRDAEQLDDFVERLIVARLSQADAVDLVQDRDDSALMAELQARRVQLRAQLDGLDDDLDQGRITRARWLRRNDKMRAELSEVDLGLAQAAAVDPLLGVVGTADVRAAWYGTRPDRSDGYDLAKRRAILDRLMVVTVLKVHNGRGRDGKYFDPNGIDVFWRD